MMDHAPHLRYLTQSFVWLGGTPIPVCEADPPQIRVASDRRTVRVANVPKGTRPKPGAKIPGPPGLERAPMTLDTVDAVNKRLRMDREFLHVFCRCVLEPSDA